MVYKYPNFRVILSLCSQRTNTIVKNIRHRPKSLEFATFDSNCVKVATEQFETMSDPKMSITVIKAIKTSKYYFGPAETVLVGRHSVPAKVINTWNGNHYIITYWEDEDFGLRMIADYICDLFGVDLTYATIRNDHRRMLDWLLNRQSFLKCLDIRAQRQANDEDFQYVLLNNNSEFLKIEARMARHFRLKNFDNKLEFVTFSKCHWITIENLMTVDARRIEVSKEKVFTNEELNKFLKHWINGENPRFKQIRLYLKTANEETYFNGINVVEGTPGVRQYKGLYGFNIFINHGAYIVRIDGTKASFGVSANDAFILVVWPDSTGRTYESFD
uniref:FBA_2 domain-containing protein n=1 Tax=Caenorhabditis tropicalis TaxID=1561998 RepID=A0A1I7UAV1_9PELO